MLKCCCYNHKDGKKKQLVLQFIAFPLWSVGSGGHVRTADVVNEEKLRHIVAMDLFFFLKYLRLPFICFVNGSVIKASNSFNRE